MVNSTIGPYVALKDGLQAAAGKALWWVRDITLSNTMWGNRAPVLDHPRAGVHALGGGIGQGLAMGIGAAIASAEHALGRKTVVLAGVQSPNVCLSTATMPSMSRMSVTYFVTFTTSVQTSPSWSRMDLIADSARRVCSPMSFGWSCSCNSCGCL
jgi:acetolactate synthase-1/2/3 large subunit